jgi:hypothetical protein
MAIPKTSERLSFMGEKLGDKLERLRKLKAIRDLEPDKPIQVKVSGSWSDSAGGFFAGLAFISLVISFLDWGGFEALAELLRELAK